MLQILNCSTGTWIRRSRSFSDADLPPAVASGGASPPIRILSRRRSISSFRFDRLQCTARNRFGSIECRECGHRSAFRCPRVLGESLVPLAQLSTHRCGISLTLGARVRPAADISCGVRYGRRILCWLFQPDRPDRPSCNRTRLAAALIDCPTCDGVRRLPRPLWLGLRLSAVLEAPTRIPQGGIGPLLVPAAASYHLHCRRC